MTPKGTNGSGARWWEDTPKEWAAQLAARSAIMEIPLFPELEKRLTRVFGVTPAMVFVHQIVYWFGRPGMADRWTMYKTADEWHEERGLNRNALKRARKRAMAAGVIAEKKGPYKKIHYRPDWVRLAYLLRLDCAVPDAEDTADVEGIEEAVDPRPIPLRGPTQGETNGIRSTPLRDRSQNATLKASRSIDTLGAQSNTENYAEEQLAEDYALQASAERLEEASADALTDAYVAPLNGGDNAFTPPQVLPRLDEETKTRVREMIVTANREDDVSRFCDHHLNGKVDKDGVSFTVERVAEKVRERLGDEEDLTAYTPWVQRCLEDRRLKRQKVSPL